MMTMTMIMINGQNQNKLFMGEKGLLYMVGVKNLLPKSLPPTPPPFTDGFQYFNQNTGRLHSKMILTMG